MSPGAPPLLTLAPGFRALYAGGQVLEYDGAFAAPAPDYPQLLEAAEYERARQRAADPERLVWRPSGEALRQFLRECEAHAAAAGELLIHSRLEPPVPLEAVRLADSDWASRFAVIRLAARKFESSAPAPSPPARRKRRVLVYWNPAGGDPLAVARREAEDAAARFESGADVRFVARSLSPGELGEAVAAADSLLYYGHGRSAAGQPLAPAGRDWAPLISPAAIAAGPLDWVVYQACHAGEEALRPGGAQAVLYPACRIADRLTEYNRALIAALASGQDLPRAARAAAAADAEAGDVRRFMFRVQCAAVQPA